MPAGLLILTYVLAGGCLLAALWQRPWRQVPDSARQHGFLGACVAVLLLWSLRAGLSPGLAIHLSGMTTVTLTWGWPLALLAPALAAAGVALAGVGSWSTAALDYLCAGAVPVVVSWWLCRLVDRHLPHHLFVYLFVVVFGGGALAAVAGSLVRALLLGAAGVYGSERLGHEYLGLLPLFALPEALVNGFIMTGLVILRPRWVVTFDERRYLDEQ